MRRAAAINAGPALVVDVAVAAAWSRALPQAVRLCRRAARAAFAAAPSRAKPKARHIELAIVLTSDAAVRKLNARYRQQDKATDVLSFPAWDKTDTASVVGLGDVIIAKGVVAREAKAENKTLAAHLSHLVVHGVLHLLGYDHMASAEARTMERLEISILKGLGLADPYRAAPAPKNRKTRVRS